MNVDFKFLPLIKSIKLMPINIATITKFIYLYKYLQHIKSKRVMKAQNLQSSVNSIQPSNNNYFIKCCSNNKAYDFCFNQNCKQQNVFTCFTQNCSCGIGHETCPKGKLQYALKSIKAKLIRYDDLEKHIYKTIDKMIDQLSILKQQLIKDLETKLTFFHLYDVQKKLLFISENKLQCTSINTEDTSFLWILLHKKMFETPSHILQLSKQILLQFESNYTDKVKYLRQQIQKEDKVKADEQPLHIYLFKNSSICQNMEINTRFIRMFPKKIKKLELIFKASQHNFSLPQYYEVCGNVQNTIILGLTNKDKIFGGFTPFCFYSGKDEWVVDSKKESFLFSLTQNQKFNLTDERYCIYRRGSKQQQIRFGSDFYIRPNANTNRNNVTGNKNYYASNPKYNKDKQSWLKTAAAFDTVVMIKVPITLNQ